LSGTEKKGVIVYVMAMRRVRGITVNRMLKWACILVLAALASGYRHVPDSVKVSAKAGEATEDNWSQVTIPGGPGEPAIEFTHVPNYGSYDDLQGRVWHVDPAEHRVAVYIYVSGWWTKPYWSRPLTTIQSNGGWACDITTGGIDQRATRIAAYLLPKGAYPPSMSGGGVLPGVLDKMAVAKVEATRTP